MPPAPDAVADVAVNDVVDEDDEVSEQYTIAYDDNTGRDTLDPLASPSG